MNNDNWNYFYKIVGSSHTIPTNLLYTPLINDEGNVLCMLWDENSPYQKENPRLTKDLINFFFEREVNHLTLFQQYSWAPKIIDIDLLKRQIFIEFNKETLNHSIFTPGRNLNQECPNWRMQLNSILTDIVIAGYYKMALYPHCFFLDNCQQIKTIDFYSCVGIEERYIERKNLEGMIGLNSVERFNSATVDDKIDFKIFFENTVKNHLKNAWPENPFEGFIQET
jgi:hypothetical protein